MAKIVLLRPPGVDVASSFLRTRVVPPLALAYLAGALRAKGHTPLPLDALGEGRHESGISYTPKARFRGLSNAAIIDRLKDLAPLDGIAVTSMFSQDWPHQHAILRDIAKEFPNVPVIVGGEHATAAAPYILESTPPVTFTARGEGEETIVDFADWCDNVRPVSDIAGVSYRSEGGAVVTNPNRARMTKLEDIPRPAWDLFDMEMYLTDADPFGVERGRSMPILATRGCPYRCTFCSSPQMWTTRYVMRDPADVVDEIEGYIKTYKADNIDFYDLTAVVRKSWILAFCAEVEKRNLKFTYQLPSGTRSEALDSEVLHAMYRTGCRNLTYAPESGSRNTLEVIKKKVDLDKITDSVKEAVKAGIVVKINLIIGFPKERRRDVYKTLLYCWKLALVGIDDAGVYLFSPYPGTELYEYLRTTGKISNMSDEYFATLLHYSDITVGSSYCENINERELGFYRTLCMAVFYGLAYLRRPSRIVRTFKNLRANRAESSFESRLSGMLQRRAVDKASDKAYKKEQTRRPAPVDLVSQ